MNKNDFVKLNADLSQEQLKLQNENANDAVSYEHQQFSLGYKNEHCYLCNKSFKTQSKSNPCIHWLLRKCKFKKKDFVFIYEKFGYLNIASYLRWVANEEQYHRNINNIDSLKSDRKLFEYTVRWKNIEWTFDCSNNDYAGHSGTRTDYPHYHFQMRIDNRPFINFGDFHVPFNKEDLFKFGLLQEHPDQFNFSFGYEGAGMQEAIEIDVSNIIEESIIVENLDDATYDMSTMILPKEDVVDLDALLAVYEESKATGKTVASLAGGYFSDADTIKTIVSPSRTILPISKRTERKRR